MFNFPRYLLNNWNGLNYHDKKDMQYASAGGIGAKFVEIHENAPSTPEIFYKVSMNTQQKFEGWKGVFEKI